MASKYQLVATTAGIKRLWWSNLDDLLRQLLREGKQRGPRVMTELEQLRRIVIAIGSDGHPYAYGPFECALCVEASELYERSDDLTDEQLQKHGEDCPYRLAVEYVRAKEGTE